MFLYDKKEKIIDVYALLKQHDISSQLDLFDVKCLNSVNLDELEKAAYCDMVPFHAYENALKKAEDDAYVIKFVKEKRLEISLFLIYYKLLQLLILFRCYKKVLSVNDNVSRLEHHHCFELMLIHHNLTFHKV